MSDDKTAVPIDDVESDEEDVAEQLVPGTVAAVVTGTDWTTETIVSQLRRGNIDLSPRFQRRDAWKRDRKSRLIESLILGLPIPQIVLAESKTARGKFIVLDGKQRLLAILQFWGLGEGPNNAYSLSGLTLRGDLSRKSFEDLSNDASLEADYNALCNQVVRTVVIRSWKDSNFLHTVFLRLNTGSVALSPQELRQALQPGDFSNYVDDAAAQSANLKELLNIKEADPRMRDIEILARFLAFRFFGEDYPGRMKEFLDATFAQLNSKWQLSEDRVKEAVADFERGLELLLDTFPQGVARKLPSRQFNRAIFDALIHFHSQSSIRAALADKQDAVRAAYNELVANERFTHAVESDTASALNTWTRLRMWAECLSEVSGRTIEPPVIPLPEKSAIHEQR